MATKKILIGIVIAAVLLGVFGFWFWQKNSFSKENLKFEILGPKEAAMAQEISYLVKWKNNGNVVLENSTLTFEYPEGSVPTEGSNHRVTKTLDPVYPGQESTFEFRARLFGAQGDIKTAKAHIAYSPRNLQARYEGNTVLATLISSVPLTFDVDLPSRTESDQFFVFTINYFSNSEYPLAGTRIKIDYPDGFEFKEALPKPIGKNEWSIGLLNKNKGGRITVQGKLKGELQAVKNFHATLGTWNNGEFTLFKEVIRGIEIAQPKIQISQVINGESLGTVHAGDMLHYEISFRNISDKDLENLFLIVNLSSPFFDFDSLRIPAGTFKKGDSSIVWDGGNNASLRFLGQGEEGVAEFWVKIKDSISTGQQGSLAKNFVLHDKVSLSDANEEFDIKINSKLAINQTAYSQDEVFGNEGPMPPLVGQRTTYTVLWKAQNLYNDVSNVKAKAILPEGVELTGKIFPEDSSLTFDSQSREIVWTIGAMNAGAGVAGLPTSVAFQVELTPNSAQRGSVAQLVKEVKITGDDTWTIQSVVGLDVSLDTSLPDDITSMGKGIVQ